MSRNPSQQQVRDAKARPIDTHYVNIYRNGKRVFSKAFCRESLAVSWCNATADNTTLSEGTRVAVEEAVGWKVGDAVFGTFWEALLHKWINLPNATVEGVFASDVKAPAANE